MGTQEDIDTFNADFVIYTSNEAAKKLIKHRSEPTAKTHTTSKPHWNDESRSCRDIIHQKENIFLSFKGCHRKRMALRSEYILANNSFYILLRQTERNFRRAQAQEIDNLNTNNPNEFRQ